MNPFLDLILACGLLESGLPLQTLFQHDYGGCLAAEGHGG